MNRMKKLLALIMVAVISIWPVSPSVVHANLDMTRSLDEYLQVLDAYRGTVGYETYLKEMSFAYITDRIFIVDMDTNTDDIMVGTIDAPDFRYFAIYGSIQDYLLDEPEQFYEVSIVRHLFDEEEDSTSEDPYIPDDSDWDEYGDE